MRRKLFHIVVAYLSGIAFASIAIDLNALFTCSVGILLIILWIKIYGFQGLLIFWIITGSIVFSIHTYHFECGRGNDYIGETVEIEGEICEASKTSSGKIEYVCRIEKLSIGENNLKNVNAKIVVRDTQGQIPFEDSPGASLLFTCELEKPENASNPGMFNYRRYLYSREISFVGRNVTVNNFEKSKQIHRCLQRYILSMREDFVDSIEDELLKSMIQSVIFGCSKVLPEEIHSTFQRNGTAHVLAVSGLHIGVLYACYEYLRRKTGLKILELGFVIILLIYGTCAMWAVSVKRAGLLILLKLLASKLDRPFDLVTATSLAAFIICINNPYEVFSVGFQLSFLAVCILSFVPRAVERAKFKGISGPVIIQLLLAPYICFVFNYFSLSGFIANIPVIFIVSIFVPIGILYFITYSLTGCSFDIVERILSGLSNMTVGVNELIYFGGKGAFDVQSIGVCAIVLFYLTLFIITSEDFTIDVLRLKKKKIFLKFFMVLAICILLFAQEGGFLYDFEQTKTTPSGLFRKAAFVFTDMNDSECMHIRFEDNFDMLIDGGGKQNFNNGKKGLKPYLLKNGVTDIDVAIPSIIDDRHYLGLFQLSKCFDVKENLLWAKYGDCIKVSERRKIEVLWPENFDISDLDSPNNRRVLKIYYDDFSCIVYGGLDKKNEEALIEKYSGTDVLCCDIVKISVPEFGRISISDFLDVSKPKFAVISYDETDESMSNEMIENIKGKDIILYRTNQLGAVGFILDKENIKVCTQQKNMRLKPLLKN